MGIVIDTNVFIDAERKRLDLHRWIKKNQAEEAYLAVVSVSELLVSVHLAGTQDEQIRRSAFVEGIISTMPILDFTVEIARIYAELIGFCRRSSKHGKTRHIAHDLQIAATAIAHGHTVLTSNLKDFCTLPGVRVECP